MKKVLEGMACVVVIAWALPAQRMGHSNSHAPRVTQSIVLADRVTIKIDYTSITWASGTWDKALQDPKTRDSMRERINSTAAENPLGSFETDTDLMLAGQHVPKGAYKLAFTLDGGFAWQLTLSGEHVMKVPLPLKSRKKSSARLVLNLNGGDEDETAILAVAFGAKGCVLAVRPHSSKPSSVSASNFVNQKCPLMDEPIDPEVTVTHKGKTIGLCCEDCIEDWAKLSTGEKDEHLAKMLSKKK